MLESLRGLGYSPGGALADIIDNSISAGASEVRLDFVWATSKSHISVLDDGRGMDDQELESALTLGDKNPFDVRAAHDLGRFGMGLKTASFSQCKRLTVASKKEGVLSCLRWDLEVLAANPESEWLLFEGPAEGSQPIVESLQTIKMLGERKVKVIVLQLGNTDLTSAAGKLLLTMLAAVAEMERDLLVERTQAGLQRAKAEGKILGRPSKTSPEQRKAILDELGRGESVSEMARLYGVSRANIYGIRDRELGAI